MPDVVTVVLVAGGLAWWWRHARRRYRLRALPPAYFASDADVALHVAHHEATTRRQPMTPVHLLYGLIQDDGVIAAIERTGGSVAAVEDHVFAALEADAAPSGTEAGAEAERECALAVARAAGQAHHGGRLASCTDLWAYFVHTAAAKQLAVAGVEPVAVLYTLVHDVVDGEPARAPATRDVDMVLRNDHYTTQEFVVEVLRDVFELPEADAVARMTATHTQGSALLGRFPASAARAKLAAVRGRARAHGFPLRIDAEPR